MQGEITTPFSSESIPASNVISVTRLDADAGEIQQTDRLVMERDE